MEIRGIPDISSDTREDTNEIVVELGRKIGVDLKKEDISTSYRLPSKRKANGVFRLINRRCLVLTDLFDDRNRD